MEKVKEKVNYNELYDSVRELNGATRLKNPMEERLIHMLVKGVPLIETLSVIKITEEEANSILSRPEVIRRLEYKKKNYSSGVNANLVINTPQEAILFARNALIKVYKKSNEAKDKISALKAIGELSMKEIESKKALELNNAVDRTKEKEDKENKEKEDKEKEDLSKLPQSLRNK